mgnify:CR=1 FL=1
MLKHAGHRRRIARRLAAASAAFIGVMGTAAGPARAKDTGTATAQVIGVIVRYESGSEQAARDATVQLGGTIGHRLDLISAFTAKLPDSQIGALRASSGVVSVTTDGVLHLRDGSGEGERWATDIDLGPFSTVNAAIGAPDVWRMKDAWGLPVTGRGIGVAVIDTGIAPVEGLTSLGKVIDGPDLSFESQWPALAHQDSFGHGTNMAGIIAGRDPLYKLGGPNDPNFFVGVAPGAHLIDVKVGAADGAADVSQVIAAIDWVVEHRNDSGLNIRVLNLSFGTVALQSYQLDPLAFAVEQAWSKGIVVVVSAGNAGAEGTVLNNPAIDPYVIAVGAADIQGTADRSDDLLASFSSVGSATRMPDLVAPGRSITSLRVQGSWIDEQFPDARMGTAGSQRFFRGSGTSQAAAVVSGGAALLLHLRPGLTPDQVKYVLTHTATPLPAGNAGAGAGLIDLPAAVVASTSGAPVQSFPRSTGTGSLELARGGTHVVDASGVELIGEFDIFGRPWNASAWAAASAGQNSWVGGRWNGTVWSGDGFDTTWTTKTWRTATWEYSDWSGMTWRDESWAGKTWRDGSWDGMTWRDGRWEGMTWRDDSWTGKTWRGDVWTGLVWR